MLVQRIVTGLVGMLVTFFVVNQGGALFSAAVAVLAATAWHEYCGAFARFKLRPSYALGMLGIAFVLGCAHFGQWQDAAGVMTLTTLLVLSKAVLFSAQFSIRQACVSVCGVFYIALPFAHLILLRAMEGQALLGGALTLGCALVWTMFIGTWASDTFAFFVGSHFGKHKLCPKISPGKTKEGFAGAIAGTIALTTAFGAYLGWPLGHMAALGALIAVTGTIGDLVESSFKRLTGIKDSGSFLPGHGGAWDRFDSVLFTAPMVYYYVQLMRIFEQ